MAPMNLSTEKLTELLIDLKANVQALEELVLSLAAVAPESERAAALRAFASAAEGARVSSLYKRTTDNQQQGLGQHLDRLAATLRGLG
jgi:hypothetical protein